MLREIVRKATPETEAYWLQIVGKFSYHALERLLRRTPYGGIPGDPGPDGATVEPHETELSAVLSKESMAMFQRILRGLSHRAGRPVRVAEALDWMFAHVLSGCDLPDEDEMERAREEAGKDLAAQSRAADREVQRARELARQMGLVPGASGDAPTEAAPGGARPGPGAEPVGGAAGAGEPSPDPPDGPARVGLDRTDDPVAQPRLAQEEVPGDAAGQDGEHGRGSGAAPLSSDRGAAPGRPAPISSEIEDPVSRPPWVLVAAEESACPGQPDLALVSRTRTPLWLEPSENHRLHFNPEARHLTPAQHREVLRRDCYRCSTPGCTNHLWLHAHHIVYYCRGGPTLPTNVLACCSKCHRNIHEGWLRVTGTAPEGLVWTDRRGRRMDRFDRPEVPDWLSGWVLARKPPKDTGAPG